MYLVLFLCSDRSGVSVGKTLNRLMGEVVNLSAVYMERWGLRASFLSTDTNADWDRGNE
ncbi:MAG: hypothetical protein QM786_07940 [Breznakibacter sp.]